MSQGQSPHIDTDSLSAYLDGAVSTDESEQIAGHLSTCAHCRRELAELRTTVALLRGLPQFQPRRSFQLGREYRRSRFVTSPTLLPAVRALAIAAVVLFVVVTGFAYIRGQPAEDRSEGPAALMQESSDEENERDGTNSTTGTRSGAQSSLNAEATTADDPADALMEDQEAAAPESAGDSDQPSAQGADAAPTGTVAAGEVGPSAGPMAADEQATEPAEPIDRWALASVALGTLAAVLLVAWVGLARARARRPRL